MWPTGTAAAAPAPGGGPPPASRPRSSTYRSKIPVLSAAARRGTPIQARSPVHPAADARKGSRPSSDGSTAVDSARCEAGAATVTVLALPRSAAGAAHRNMVTPPPIAPSASSAGVRLPTTPLRTRGEECQRWRRLALALIRPAGQRARRPLATPACRRPALRRFQGSGPSTGRSLPRSSPSRRHAPRSARAPRGPPTRQPSRA